ncbi:hypothetical protein ACIRSU_23050 [Streptomyces sp. NPDC101160]|uniref:hypothetical protein n=1 Tax=Streptomyces sp. NPDC101160 TaxID=3366118 RepID=UPI00382B0B02
MATTRRVRRTMLAAVAALAMGVGMAQTATSSQPGDGRDAAAEVAAAAPVKARLTGHPKEVTPSGKAQAKHPRPVPPPRLTATKRELDAAARQAPGAKRPRIGNRKGQAPLLAPPGKSFSYEGATQNTGLYPPDTHGAVGKVNFVEVTNGEGVSVFTKTTGTLQKQTSFASFFNYTDQTIFDPRVAYDKTWNRWVVTAEAFPEAGGAQYYFVAVSKTSDPKGSYVITQINVSGLGGFFDYPQLGLDQDAVLTTANIFSDEDAYLGSVAFGIGKAQLYNGLDFDAPAFDLGTPGTVAPPIVEDNNTNSFFVAASPADNTHLKLFKGSNLGRSAATIVTAPDVTVSAFSAPAPASQPGTDQTLDALDARFQNNSTQIGNQLLNVHSTGSVQSTPTWYQINTGTSALTAGGIFYETATSDDFNPSIVGSTVNGTNANPIGQFFVTWSATDIGGMNTTPHQVRVKGSGRLATDPVSFAGGSTFGPTASTFYNPDADPVGRWGDYSAVAIDPSPATNCPVGNRAYLVNERQNSQTQWSSRWGRLGFC